MTSRRSGARSAGRFLRISAASALMAVRLSISSSSISRCASSSSTAVICCAVKPYSITISAAGFPVIVICRIFSVQLSSVSSSGSLSAWWMVSTVLVMIFMSKKTAFKRFTRSASIVTTSVASTSLLPAVLTAKIASTSTQSAISPAMVTSSYVSAPCSASNCELKS